MAKQSWIHLTILVLLAVVYICVFTKWGRQPAMQITHAAGTKLKGPIGPRVKAGSVNTVIVTFGLDRPYRLTEVKVVRLADWQTNNSTLPLWHLVSVSNSVPTRRFSYGAAIGGMKPAVANLWPKPLETNITYRLFLVAGPVKGQHDFVAPPK